MKNTSYLLLLFCVIFISTSVNAQKKIKLGIIGLDTSHSPAFVELINSENPKPEYQGFEVVVAYPYGSKTIKSSFDRIPRFTEDVKKFNVKIANSIQEVLDLTDCIFLETNDGNLHLEQALEVFKAGKPVFIDKPIGANLAQTLAIVTLAERYNIPIFSSSALRFVKQNQDLRTGQKGKVFGVDYYTPCTNEPSHAGFYWYGIHGVETLYTILGEGCKSVSCTSTEGADFVVGLWKDGRIGTYRGIRDGKNAWGGVAICENSIEPAGPYDGYNLLLAAILNFFKTKQSPVDIKETIEIYTFMEAANESKRKNGIPVNLEKTYKKGIAESNKILKNIK